MLTVAKRVCGDILERGEGLVLLEALGEMLGGLCVKVVLLETAYESRIALSAAADSGESGREAAYSSVWSAEFVLRASERCLAASASSPLAPRLRTRAESVCQRIDSREKGVWRRT